jgi:hypothetical protein
MTQAEEIKLLKSRVLELEALMSEVTQALGIGRVDDAALEAAMLRMLSGDNTALDRYLRRGGKIPKGIAA